MLPDDNEVDDGMKRTIRPSVDTVRVAVSQREERAEEARAARDTLSQNWAPCFDRWGVTPCAIGNRVKNPGTWMRDSQIDAVLLTGGNDPCAPGTTRAQGNSPHRDRTERAMIRHARAHRMPVVAVGRGALCLVLYYGGSVRDAVETPRQEEPPTSRELRLADCLGSGSLHVTGPTRLRVDPANLPPSLEALAWSDELGVELFRHRTEPMLGALWLPERSPGGESRTDGLFRAALRGEPLAPLPHAADHQETPTS